MKKKLITLACAGSLLVSALACADNEVTLSIQTHTDSKIVVLMKNSSKSDIGAYDPTSYTGWKFSDSLPDWLKLHQFNKSSDPAPANDCVKYGVRAGNKSPQSCAITMDIDKGKGNISSVTSLSINAWQGLYHSNTLDIPYSPPVIIGTSNLPKSILTNSTYGSVQNPLDISISNVSDSMVAIDNLRFTVDSTKFILTTIRNNCDRGQLKQNGSCDYLYTLTPKVPGNFSLPVTVSYQINKVSQTYVFNQDIQVLPEGDAIHILGKFPTAVNLGSELKLPYQIINLSPTKSYPITTGSNIQGINGASMSYGQDNTCIGAVLGPLGSGRNTCSFIINYKPTQISSSENGVVTVTTDNSAVQGKQTVITSVLPKADFSIIGKVAGIAPGGARRPIYQVKNVTDKNLKITDITTQLQDPQSAKGSTFNVIPTTQSGICQLGETLAPGASCQVMTNLLLDNQDLPNNYVVTSLLVNDDNGSTSVLTNNVLIAQALDNCTPSKYSDSLGQHTLVSCHYYTSTSAAGILTSSLISDIDATLSKHVDYINDQMSPNVAVTFTAIGGPGGGSHGSPDSWIVSGGGDGGNPGFSLTAYSLADLPTNLYFYVGEKGIDTHGDGTHGASGGSATMVSSSPITPAATLSDMLIISGGGGGSGGADGFAVKNGESGEPGGIAVSDSYSQDTKGCGESETSHQGGDGGCNGIGGSAMNSGSNGIGGAGGGATEGATYWLMPAGTPQPITPGGNGGEGSNGPGIGAHHSQNGRGGAGGGGYGGGGGASGSYIQDGGLGAHIAAGGGGGGGSWARALDPKLLLDNIMPYKPAPNTSYDARPEVAVYFLFPAQAYNNS
ncbi:hypothetical protein [Cysteiniphilum litorale]|uniref:hypothetical protein n=1 Tax=Cysteiniphilum litorale TaxID=2056700 RepID=UPI003F88544F